MHVHESEECLKDLLTQEKDVRRKERLQFLYWLKTGQIKSFVEIAKLLNRSRLTLSNWLCKYEAGGIESLLERKSPQGSISQIDGEILEALKSRINSPEGFNSYVEIQNWLLKRFGLEVSYHTVFHTCHRKLKGSPKVPRPQNPQQDPEAVDAFKKT